jgi:hypothetical protein
VCILFDCDSFEMLEGDRNEISINCIDFDEDSRSLPEFPSYFTISILFYIGSKSFIALLLIGLCFYLSPIIGLVTIF